MNTHFDMCAELNKYRLSEDDLHRSNKELIGTNMPITLHSALFKTWEQAMQVQILYCRGLTGKHELCTVQHLYDTNSLCTTFWAEELQRNPWLVYFLDGFGKTLFCSETPTICALDASVDELQQVVHKTNSVTFVISWSSESYAKLFGELVRLYVPEAAIKEQSNEPCKPTCNFAGQETSAESTTAPEHAESGAGTGLAAIEETIAELDELTADLTLLSFLFTSISIACESVSSNAGELADGNAVSAVDVPCETLAGAEAATPVAASTGNPLLDALF